MTKKLKLNDMKVTSFVTMNLENAAKVKGGAGTHYEWCETGVCTEQSPCNKIDNLR